MNRIVKRNLEDVAELILAAWLVVSPFLLGYSAQVEATLSAVMIGALLAFTAQMGVARPARWEEYINLALAIFLIFTPLIFNFTSLMVASINAVASGLVLAVLCGIALVQQRQLDRESGMPTGAA